MLFRSAPLRGWRIIVGFVQNPTEPAGENVAPYECRERPLCRSVGFYQTLRADEVTATPLPFCRFATFSLIGKSSSAPTRLVRCFAHRRDSPRGCPFRGRFVKRPYGIRVSPSVLDNLPGRAWKVSPTGSVGASAYFRMQRSPPETRTPPLRLVRYFAGYAQSSLSILRELPHQQHGGDCADSGDRPAAECPI